MVQLVLSKFILPVEAFEVSQIVLATYYLVGYGMAIRYIPTYVYLLSVSI